MFAFKIFYLAKNAERGKKCQIWLHFPFWPILEFFQRGKKRVIRQKIPKIWPKWLKMVLSSDFNGIVPLLGHKILRILAGFYYGIRAIASLFFTAENNVGFNGISNARGNVSTTTASHWGLKEVYIFGIYENLSVPFYSTVDIHLTYI